MKKYTRMATGRNNQRGAVAVVVGILILVLVSFVALSVDTGYLYGTRNELQNAADAAALAAARQLGIIYQGLPPAEQQSYVCDPDTIIPIAKEVGQKNHAAGEMIVIEAADVTIGTWDGTTLTQTYDQPDAVRVVASRNDSNHGGKVATFFARIFGIDEVVVSADATAALTGQGTAGDLELPIGISEGWFDPPRDWCGEIIMFSPTTDPRACGGWNTFDSEPANDNKVGQILDDMLADSMESPLVSSGVTEFQFTNGDLSENTFESLMTLYQNRGYDVDRVYTPTGDDPEPVVYIDEEGNLTDASGQPSAEPILKPDKSQFPLYDPDSGEIDPTTGEIDPTTLEQLRYPPCSGASGCSGDPRFAHEWQTTIAVYEGSDCTPGKDMKIKGFVEVVLFDVGMPSNKTVAARIKCNIIKPNDTRGGGGNFGIRANIPNLVE